MPPSVVLLTPNLTGHDGISAVARLVAGAFDRVSIVALHEPASLTSFAGATVQGAGGSGSRFAFSALRAAVARSGCHGDRQPPAPCACGAAVRRPRRASSSILHGVEAWTPLTWLQRAALDAQRSPDRDLRVFARPLPGGESRSSRLAPSTCVTSASVRRRCRTSPSDRTPAALIVGRMTADERYKGHDALHRDLADRAGVGPRRRAADRRRRRRSAAARTEGRRPGLGDARRLRRRHRRRRAAAGVPARCTVVRHAEPRRRVRPRVSRGDARRRAPVSAAAAPRPRSSTTARPAGWSSRTIARS